VTLGFTLANGESCKVGVVKFNNSHIFDTEKKITKVEVIIHKDEEGIMQVNFYSGK
jgi:hypothetical protein